MQFMHRCEYLRPGGVVVADCSHRRNVRLMSDADFGRYRRGGSFQGGHFDRLPARIAVPGDGYWNITLDLGGGSASIRHSIAA